MSLRDQSCYTLQLHQSTTDPAIVELVEVEGVKRESRYARVREGVQGEAYSAAVYDYMTGAKLASVGYEADRAKKRRLQLHGPDENVAFDMTGKINFEWTFQFQGHKFRWTKEVYGKDYVCSMDRKPDPKVEICLARGADKAEPGRIQILHYNIERFPDEITDLRGLETLLVTSFMCFIDVQDDRWKPSPRPTPVPGSSSSSIEGKALPGAPVEEVKAITEDDFEPENPNEIIVSMQSNMDDHIARACGLLLDPGVIFIVIRTRKAEAAQRALQVSLGVTRFRHREGLGDLHQYVIGEDDTQPPTGSKEAKGPKVISLDDPKPEPRIDNRKASGSKKPEWKSPSNIAIYLSTIDLPDLHPSRRGHSNGASAGAAALASPPAASVSPAAAAASHANGSGSGSKLNKKPTKVFVNPLNSGGTKESGKGTSAGGVRASKTSAVAKDTLAPPPRLSSRPNTSDRPSSNLNKPTATASASASASGSPGGAAAHVPQSPSPSTSPTPGAAGNGQQAQGGEGKLSGLARLIAISRK